jgi:hypothetical protein
MTTEPSYGDWEPILIAAHYRFAAFDGLNRCNVREEDHHLVDRFATLADVFDNFVPHKQLWLHRARVPGAATTPFSPGAHIAEPCPWSGGGYSSSCPRLSEPARSVARCLTSRPHQGGRSGCDQWC